MLILFVFYSRSMCTSVSIVSADVRTQAMYQLLDSGFIGLIFSCFNEDQYKVLHLTTTTLKIILNLLLIGYSIIDVPP